MKLKLFISLLFLFSLFCEDEQQVKEEVAKTESKIKNDLSGFSPACTTISDEVIIKVHTKNFYDRDSVLVKVSFENMMAKNYPVCRNMKLNFPLYPIIKPSVNVKEIVDSMDYLFDTLGPGESIIKDFNFSRYCDFSSGNYNVSFLYTSNAATYKNEKLKGLRLSSFTLNIKE